jgi:ribosomal protein S9
MPERPAACFGARCTSNPVRAMVTAPGIRICRKGWVVRLLLAAWLGTGICAAASAQGGIAVSPGPAAAPAVAATGNVVTGRVTCADTQRAARFAQVTLLLAEEDTEGRGRRLTARTDLDGNFVVNGAPSGDYFVTAQLTGYVNETLAVEQAVNANAGAAPAGVPRIHVGGGGASADFSLQRGGVIAGLVSWDDGSPAAGVQVSAVPPPSTGTTGTVTAGQISGPLTRGTGFGFFGGTQTDDRGRFRLTGLPAGSYLVRANVQAPMPQTGTGYARTLNLSVYAPDKVRRTEAVAIPLGVGEERDDLTIVLGLAALHTVSGAVSSSSTAVRSGTVQVTDQVDSSLNRSGVINADGSFVVPYVPAGTYTLRVNASAQLQPGLPRGGVGASGGAAVSFQPLELSVTVTDSDLTGLGLNVIPAPSTQ